MSIFLLMTTFFSASVFAVTLVSVIPSNVGVNSVRLNATIGASTDSTRLYFAYSISAINLNLKTPEITLPSSTTGATTNQLISGLQCRTTYYYRVVVNNAGAETLSDIDSFTTLGCVSVMAVISTRDASNITQQSARLNGNISLDTNYLEVSYYFEYGLNASYGKRVDGGFVGQNSLQVNVNKDIFGLLCDNTYHYRLIVKLKKTAKSDVVLSEANDFVFKTASCSLPELFSAAMVSSTPNKATISVAVNTFGKKVDVFFAWGTSSALGERTVVKNVSSGSVLEQLVGLECNTPYFFVAIMQYDSSDIRGEVQQFTTKACAQTPAVTTMAASDILMDSTSISGTVTSNDTATSAYFEWGTNDTYNSITDVQSISSAATGQIIRAELTGLDCATQYTYRIFATNSNGQIRGENLSFTTASCDVVDPQPESQPILISAQVYSGKNHSIIIGRSGEVITWGDNQAFQLGGPTIDDNLVDGVSSAAPKPGLPALYFNVIDAAAGGEHSLLLHNDAVLSFGSNASGQLGTNSNEELAEEPAWVVDEQGNAIRGIISVDAGSKHSIALRKDGSVFIWGDNSLGQLGIDQTIAQSNVPILMTEVVGAQKIVAGDNFNLAVLDDKSLLAWGENNSGQLGTGTSNRKQGVSAVVGADDINTVVAGSEHVLALQNSGSILVWGNNESGQLGVGNIENQLSPVPLDIDGRVVQLAAGGKHSVALLDDGTMLAWGDNSFGQLGIASLENTSTPTKVVNGAQVELSDIVSITAGDDFTVVVDNRGNILSWGDNSSGQLNGRASNVVEKVNLTDKFGVNISLNVPRIIVDKAIIFLDRGSVAEVKVRLSANPDSEVEVTAEFPPELEGFSIERNNRVFFSPEKVDWPIEKSITVVSAPNSVATGGVLRFSVPGFSSIDVQVKISEPTNKPKERVVGSLPPVFILFVLSWFVICRYRFVYNRHGYIRV